MNNPLSDRISRSWDDKAMRKLIRVVSNGDQWLVQVDPRLTPLAFSSGGHAERYARRLGERLAANGDAAEIQIYLRDGELAGRFLIVPEASRVASAHGSG
jgi:hypothetical protein